ncbi:MAG TPA: hypothetical protein VF488_13495 [Gemmatimonadaceae bacterium]
MEDFEGLLGKGGALWVGNPMAIDHAGDHRAIVQVDDLHDTRFSKELDLRLQSALWFLADVPTMTSTPGAQAARDAVNSSMNTEGIWAQVLGYCFSDHTFRASSTPDPQCGASVTHEVVKYDPRCTCQEAPDAQITVSP